ncbi:hypothetical protein K493DRAFT_316455 [Basidiobolus meristosporus CBS 931.73]|uniref:Uncharacterized protein n=1 Tax=Basidiobolus meristosporus CBS 931.73 TaxID=1314790 RepID=A0A1Y1Y438_9FUNG|nr:hypothetical protein K493DRAFT_316455 [Basidiobolus meristosporus CBS 931.73]|eukprot:ORX92655.1 hypothetical protein K493DRAFT_316455 [Basidiobolus meristosporus CBS 931.73]
MNKFGLALLLSYAANVFAGQAYFLLENGQNENLDGPDEGCVEYGKTITFASRTTFSSGFVIYPDEDCEDQSQAVTFGHNQHSKHFDTPRHVGSVRFFNFRENISVMNSSTRVPEYDAQPHVFAQAPAQFQPTTY